MLQIINQALMSGFTATQILKFISSKFPNLQSGIQQAQQSGFDADKILKFLSHKIPHSRESANKQINENDRYLSSIGLKTREEKEQARNKALSGALQIGAGALGGYALSRAIPAGVSAVSGLLGNQGNNLQSLQATQTPQALSQSPQSLPQQPPNVPPTAPITPGPTSPTGAIPTALQVPNIAQPPVSAQPLNPQRDIKKSIDILKNLGFEANVKNMLEGGLPPKDIAAALKTMMPKDKFKALEAQEGGIEGVINVYAEAAKQHPEIKNHEIRKPASMSEVKRLHGLWEQSGKKLPFEKVLQGNMQIDEDLAKQLAKSYEGIEQIGPEVTPEPKAPIEELTQPEKTIEQPKPIAKNSIVASPQGVGEVKEIRNGKALVEVDGKLHKVDESDLEPPTFTDDEVANAYDDLMAKIPEKHKSGFISWAGYDEDRNVIGFIPRGGKYEELHNVSPEEAQIIKAGKGVARTSGETREGLWVLGEDTRGGLISQIIHDRRKKHKYEEEKQGKFAFDLPKKEKEDKGMKPIFDEMAHARGLSRERERKKILEERERKKKEKDEAKKRKK